MLDGVALSGVCNPGNISNRKWRPDGGRLPHGFGTLLRRRGMCAEQIIGDAIRNPGPRPPCAPITVTMPVLFEYTLEWAPKELAALI